MCVWCINSYLSGLVNGNIFVYIKIGNDTKLYNVQEERKEGRDKGMQEAGMEGGRGCGGQEERFERKVREEEMTVTCESLRWHLE